MAATKPEIRISKLADMTAILFRRLDMFPETGKSEKLILLLVFYSYSTYIKYNFNTSQNHQIMATNGDKEN